MASMARSKSSLGTAEKIDPMSANVTTNASPNYTASRVAPLGHHTPEKEEVRRNRNLNPLNSLKNKILNKLDSVVDPRPQANANAGRNVPEGSKAFGGKKSLETNTDQNDSNLFSFSSKEKQKVRLAKRDVSKAAETVELAFEEDVSGPVENDDKKSRLKSNGKHVLDSAGDSASSRHKTEHEGSQVHATRKSDEQAAMGSSKIGSLPEETFVGLRSVLLEHYDDPKVHAYVKQSLNDEDFEVLMRSVRDLRRKTLGNKLFDPTEKAKNRAPNPSRPKILSKEEITAEEDDFDDGYDEEMESEYSAHYEFSKSRTNSHKRAVTAANQDEKDLRRALDESKVYRNGKQSRSMYTRESEVEWKGGDSSFDHENELLRRGRRLGPEDMPDDIAKTRRNGISSSDNAHDSESEERSKATMTNKGDHTYPGSNREFRGLLPRVATSEDEGRTNSTRMDPDRLVRTSGHTRQKELYWEMQSNLQTLQEENKELKETIEKQKAELEEKKNLMIGLQRDVQQLQEKVSDLDSTLASGWKENLKKEMHRNVLDELKALDSWSIKQERTFHLQMSRHVEKLVYSYDSHAAELHRNLNRIENQTFLRVIAKFGSLIFSFGAAGGLLLVSLFRTGMNYLMRYAHKNEYPTLAMAILYITQFFSFQTPFQKDLSKRLFDFLKSHTDNPDDSLEVVKTADADEGSPRGASK